MTIITPYNSGAGQNKPPANNPAPKTNNAGPKKPPFNTAPPTGNTAPGQNVGVTGSTALAFMERTKTDLVNIRHNINGKHDTERNWRKWGTTVSLGFLAYYAATQQVAAPLGMKFYNAAKSHAYSHDHILHWGMVAGAFVAWNLIMGERNKQTNKMIDEAKLTAEKAAIEMRNNPVGEGARIAHASGLLGKIDHNAPYKMTVRDRVGVAWLDTKYTANTMSAGIAKMLGKPETSKNLNALAENNALEKQARLQDYNTRVMTEYNPGLLGKVYNRAKVDFLLNLGELVSPDKTLKTAIARTKFHENSADQNAWNFRTSYEPTPGIPKGVRQP